MKKLFVSLLVTSLILFMSPSVFANAGTSIAISAGTEVTAKADAVYVFSAPVGGTIAYPQIQAGLGEFVVSDLFLESEEWLKVTVIPGVLYKTDISGSTLPYRVVFNPPGALNQANIGQRYSVAAEVDSNSLESAPAGTYQAVLRFRVTSHPNDTTVWEGAATLTVIRGGGAASEPVFSSTITSSQVTTSVPVSSLSTVPAVTVKSKPSVVTIESEPTPDDTPEMGALVMRYGLMFAVLALSALIILTRVIGRKKKSG